MIEVLISSGKIDDKKCRYVINTLLSVYGITNIGGKISIYYGDKINESADINILTKALAADAETYPDKIIIKEDIITETYDFLTRSVENMNSIINKPYINYYAEILGSALEKVCHMRKLTALRNIPQFTAVLSHDVDNITDKNIYVFISRLLKGIKIIKQRSLGKGLRQIMWIAKCLLNRCNNYWNFDKYVDMESKYCFRSSFYIINGEKGRRGARYKLDKVKDILISLNHSGWEVGLHTNYNSYNSFEKINAEKNNIESIASIKVEGNRDHYLNFIIPDTWKLLRKSGINYDSTIGYSTDFGFRAGIASGYYPYDEANDEVIDIVEIPVGIMDAAFMYSTEDMDEVWQKMKHVLDETIKVKGTIAVNFHMRTLYEEEFTGWADLYNRILKYIKDNGGRGITGKEYYDEFITVKFSDDILVVNDLKAE